MKTLLIIGLFLILFLIIARYITSRFIPFYEILIKGDPVKYLINGSAYFGEFQEFDGINSKVKFEDGDDLWVRTEDMMRVKGYDYKLHKW